MSRARDQGHPSMSLLHATYRRPGGPTAVRDAWLAAADRPGTIEYVFALDADDVEAIRMTAGQARVVSPAQAAVSAVRNWNAAAARATGALLVVVADDLVPPRGWDARLADLVRPLDPTVVPFAVKLTDAVDDRKVLLRHPVVSRAFYARFGLFDPAYDGVFCDEDITTRAFWRAMILDGRSIVLEHRHPLSDPAVPTTESHRRMNDDLELEHGSRLYTSSWPRFRRMADVRLVSGVPTRPTARLELALVRWWQRAAAAAGYATRRTARFATLAVRPGALLRRCLGRRRRHERG